MNPGHSFSSTHEETKHTQKSKAKAKAFFFFLLLFFFTYSYYSARRSWWIRKAGFTFCEPEVQFWCSRKKKKQKQNKKVGKKKER